MADAEAGFQVESFGNANNWTTILDKQHRNGGNEPYERIHRMRFRRARDDGTAGGLFVRDAHFLDRARVFGELVACHRAQFLG